ncbi:MAG: histidine kinase [Bacteroidia bacterium]|nr:histidine kinase [Bacteroidia bacterium]
MLRHSLLILLGLVALLVKSQSDIVHFENISREDGLAQSTITGIVQGKDGFMWFGTAEGLHRYDGYEFQIFKSDGRDTNSLASNHITSLYEDEEGYLWIGTYTGRLDRFDKKSRKFKHYRFLSGTDSSENKYQINCITRDAMGHLLVGLDGGGMAVLNQAQNTWKLYTKENSKLPNNYLKSFSAEANGLGIWIGTLQGIILYNQSQFKSFSSLNAFSNQSVNDILHYKTKLYVVTNGQGLQIWDTKTDVVVPIPPPRIRGANFTTFVLKDDEDALWIGTDGAGLLKFVGDKFTTYFNNPYDFQSIIGDNIHKGYKDNQGALWFGCINGISKYDPSLKVFNLFKEFESNGKRTNNNVYTMHESRDGMIWIGTLGGGLSRFNPKTEEIKVYPVIRDGETATKAVLSIFEDRLGTLWIGTRDEGLFSLDRNTDKFTNYPSQKERIKVKTIRSIMEDSEGTLWLGTRWGLAMFDRSTRKFTMYQSRTLNNNRICQIIENKERNELIFVTFRTGLHIFNKRTKDLIVLEHGDDSTSPSVNAMMCIEPMGNDSFLIGTYSGGVNIFDRAELSFKSITSQEGLPNDVIYGILKGDNGQYWLSSNDGLILYDFKKNNFESYNLSHYLQGLEYNESAYCKGRDNTLYFGGQNGFNYFRTVDLQKSSTPPIVAFTTFKKGNKDVELDVDINYLDKVKIAYNENLISFGFSALAFSNSKENQYEYMLEGFDNEWINAGTRREAFYTHLSHGNYTFRVRASNHLGVWSEERSIEIIVEPPFTQTWWFRILVGLAIVGVILLYIRQRTKSISRSYKHRLVDLELKALRSQMNPHFIFNSLNSIQYFVLNNEPKEAYTYLTKFSHLMRMILQNSRVKYITLQEEYDWLFTYLDLEKLRMENQLDFSIEIDDRLDKNHIYVPSMLIQPYVENAIIHGLLPKPENRKLAVSFSKHRDKLKCQIEDNGIGRKKSAELNASRTKKHKSQGIQLTGERLEILTQDQSTSREFFILDLFDDNNEPIGTRVTLFLPIVTQIEEEDA